MTRRQKTTPREDQLIREVQRWMELATYWQGQWNQVMCEQFTERYQAAKRKGKRMERRILKERAVK